MKRFLLFCLLALLYETLLGQKADSTKAWEATGEMDNNFLTEKYIPGVIAMFDRKWLHLEGRYNSEDIHMASFWGGYNFAGGRKFTYTITPMIGVMFGNGSGLLPGVGVALDWKKWTFTNETAIVLYSSSKKDERYIYTSNELDYAIDDIFYVGISLNRSKIYASPVELNAGIGGGFTVGKFTASAFIYDPFDIAPFGFISLSWSFSKD
jgi:hypothetical protein